MQSLTSLSIVELEDRTEDQPRLHLKNSVSPDDRCLRIEPVFSRYICARRWLPDINGGAFAKNPKMVALTIASE